VYLSAGDWVDAVAYHEDTATPKDLTQAYLRLVKMAAGAESTLEVAPIEDAPGARVRRSTEFTIATATQTRIPFDTEDYDSHGFWSSNTPAAFTIPAGHAGRYRVYASSHFRFTSGAFARELQIVINDTNKVAVGRDLSGLAGDGNAINCSADVWLNVGDRVEVWAYQNSGADLNVGWTSMPYQAHFSITRLATSLQGEKGDPGDSGDATPSPQVITSSAGATTSGSGHYHFSHNSLVNNDDPTVFGVSVPGANPITILAAGYYHISTTLSCATNAQMTLYVSKNGAEWADMAMWQTSVPAGTNYMTKSGVFYLAAGTTIGTGIWDAGGAKVVGQHTVTVTAIRGYRGATGAAGTALLPSGTSFPTGISAGYEFRRTDIRGGMDFFWDGTYWLSKQEYECGGYGNNITTNSGEYLPMDSDLDLYFHRVSCVFYPTSNGSDYFTARLCSRTYPGNVNTAIWTQSFAGATINQWNEYQVNLSALVSASTERIIACLLDAAGTPTPFYGGFTARYRLRAV